MSCPGGKDVQCTEFSDAFAQIQPGLLLLAQVPLGGQAPEFFLSYIGGPATPRFFAGSMRYVNHEVTGSSYACRFRDAAAGQSPVLSPLLHSHVNLARCDKQLSHLP